MGSKEQLLKALNRSEFNLETMRLVGKKYDVGSVFTGEYEISEVTPKINISEDYSSLKASTMVKISLSSRHWDTTNGATLRINSPMESGRSVA